MATLPGPAAGARQSQTPPFFRDEFTGYQPGSDGSPHWRPVKGNWQVLNGRYVQQSDEFDCASLITLYLEESFELSATFEQIDGEFGA